MDSITMDKFTQFNKIEIWHPKYSNNRVLIHPKKVGKHNKIVFTRAESLPDTYYLPEKTIRKYGKESNGSVDCYSVPLDELKKLIIAEKSIYTLY